MKKIVTVLPGSYVGAHGPERFRLSFLRLCYIRDAQPQKALSYKTQGACWLFVIYVREIAIVKRLKTAILEIAVS